jgi:predicted HicB family RNase H-like nuclease
MGDELMADVKQVSTRISSELHRKVRIKAIETGKSVSEVIREKLTEWVEDPPEETEEEP